MDNTLFKGVFGISVINKQSEDDHFKVLCVIFKIMGGNQQNIEVKQLNQTKFGHYGPKSLRRECIFNPLKPHQPTNR